MDIKTLAAKLYMAEDEFMELLLILLRKSRQDLHQLQDSFVCGVCDAAPAHSIKGAAANLGLTELAAVARNAETCAKEGCLNAECIEQLRSELDHIEAQIKA